MKRIKDQIAWLLEVGEKALVFGEMVQVKPSCGDNENGRWHCGRTQTTYYHQLDRALSANADTELCWLCFEHGPETALTHGLTYIETKPQSELEDMKKK